MGQKIRLVFPLLVLSALPLVRCGSSSGEEGGVPGDASIDSSFSLDGKAGSDGNSPVDATSDTNPIPDATIDAPSESGDDGGEDAALEAGLDAEPDVADAGPGCATCTLITTNTVLWDKGLVVDDSKVYWYVDSNQLAKGGIWSASKTGGPGALLAKVMNQYFDNPAVSQGKLWWMDTRPDGAPEYLFNADVTTGAVTVAYDDTSLNMGRIFLDRSTADWYWSNSSSGAGQMYVYHPGATSLVAFGPTLGGVSAFGGADATYFYGHEGSSITPKTVFRMSRATGVKEQYTGIPNASVWVVGADSTSIFFFQSNKIWTTPKGQLAATPTAVLDVPSYSLVDGSEVFGWSPSSPGIDKAVGSTKSIISTGTLVPYTVAVDATHAYFVTEDSNSGSGSYSIWRVPR